jgi:tol-pal system protein YbgF
MIHCKKTIIAACFTLMLPLTVWSEAPVVDDSDNFAILDGQQVESSVAHPKYDEPQIENAQIDGAQNDTYQGEDGPALVKDDQSSSDMHNDMNDNATLIDKIQKLQQEVQELRGQLEVQAHDVKLLQQQQLAFYKDLDSRLATTSTGKSAQATAPSLTIGSNEPPQPAAPAAPAKIVKITTAPVIAPASKMNPADEQISYLAAYELVKNKQYDDGINAMQIFVQKYPNGGYTANAEYWLGELYMVKKDYAQALEHFDVVLNKFPSSSKSAASMLKVGYAYAASGNTDEAIKHLQQVVKSYPGTPTAQLASSKLATINSM